MIKKNTIFLNGRKIGTYKAVLTAGSGHISFEDFEPCESKLTDDQQVVLEWLKNNYDEDADPLGVICGMQKFGLRESELFDAVEPLSDQEQFQVLAAFAEWGLNSCQNGNSGTVKQSLTVPPVAN